MPAAATRGVEALAALNRGGSSGTFRNDPGQVNPGQQVLNVQTKLITHAIRIAAFDTATTQARDIRIHNGYARANHEAHALIR